MQFKTVNAFSDGLLHVPDSELCTQQGLCESIPQSFILFKISKSKKSQMTSLLSSFTSGQVLGPAVKTLLGSLTYLIAVPGSKAQLCPASKSSFRLMQNSGGVRSWLKHLGQRHPHGRPHVSPGSLQPRPAPAVASI